MRILFNTLQGGDRIEIGMSKRKTDIVELRGSKLHDETIQSRSAVVRSSGYDGCRNSDDGLMLSFDTSDTNLQTSMRCI